jgi:hypothetical protein
LSEHKTTFYIFFESFLTLPSAFVQISTAGLAAAKNVAVCSALQYETPEAFNFFLPPEAFFPPAARGIFNTETHRNHIYYFYGNFLRLNFGASVNARLDFGGRW